MIFKLDYTASEINQKLGEMAIKDDIAIIPIERITDFGAKMTVSTIDNSVTTNIYGGASYRRDIILNTDMDNPSNYIFHCNIPDGYVVGIVWMKFGNQSLAIVFNQATSLYYHIIHDKKSRMFAIRELISRDVAKLTYDEDGNYVSKEIIRDVDSNNVVTKLNSKTASASYSPTADTDVATKEYVDSFPVFTASTSEKEGLNGIVPAPKVFDKYKFLKGDGTWGEITWDLFNISEEIIISEFKILGDESSTYVSDIHDIPLYNGQVTFDINSSYEVIFTKIGEEVPTYIFGSSGIYRTLVTDENCLDLLVLNDPNDELIKDVTGYNSAGNIRILELGESKLFRLSGSFTNLYEAIQPNFTITLKKMKKIEKIPSTYLPDEHINELIDAKAPVGTYIVNEIIENINIVWDGTVGGRVTGTTATNIVKVSDLVFTNEELKTMTLIDNADYKTQLSTTMEAFITDDYFAYGDSGFIVIRKANISGPDGCFPPNNTFPETGIYFGSSHRKLISNNKFEWDRNTDDKITANDSNGNVYAYKISDVIITKEQCIGGTVITTYSEIVLTNDDIIETDIGIYHSVEFGIIVVKKPGVILLSGGAGDITFPETGVYFTKDVLSFTISGYSISKEVIKTLDPKFIPEENRFILKSSTEGSSKRFQITVDDAGTISATEITT